MRAEHEAALRGLDGGERGDDPAQAADLDAQPRAMRLVGVAGAKGLRDQGLAPDVARPRLGEGARQGEQHRAAGQRQPGLAGAQAAAAGVEHQRVGGEEGGHLVEAQRLLVAGGEAPRGGPLQGGARLVHFGLQGGHPGALGGLAGAGERVLRRADAQRAQRQLGPRSARPPPPARAATRVHRARRAPLRAPRAPARSRRDGRAAAGGARRSAAPAAHWHGRRARRARPRPPPARAASRRGRASPAPPRPRPRRSGRAPSPRGRRSRARPGAAARAPAGARRAGPWRCRAAPGPAGRRAARPA